MVINMFDIDFIIPCYGESAIIEKGIASLAIQWHKEFIHVTLVNDYSPNTDCNYQDLINKYSKFLDIKCIKTPENVGQGLARQFGIDNTFHDYFMFMDEDDQLGTGVSVSLFVGAVECAGFLRDQEGNIICDDNGLPMKKEDEKPVSLVSAPLFVFDNNTSYTIDNTNRVWVNSKLYNRKFVEKHNIRFNEAQSRHAEDYYWMSCFFYAMDNDSDYQGILLDNSGIYYLWYPNEKSQSRIDPNYAYMLSGYTMNGSVNILNYIKNGECNGVGWNTDVEKQYREMLLNMTMYSYFTFFSFVRHVAQTDYVPKEEDDWYILRDSCNELRNMVLDGYFSVYSYTEKIEQYYIVKNHTDVLFTEPWIVFDDYVLYGCEELEWDFKKLLECKNKMHFSEEGFRLWDI